MSNNAYKNRITPEGKMFFGPGHLAPPPADLQGQINELIDKALEDETARQRPRDYLGGSRVGQECQRRLAYEYFKTCADREAWDANQENHRTDHGFDGAILRRFALGHLVEDEVARLLRLAGFILHTDMGDGRQFGWSTAGGRMRGHADGIVEDGPVALPYPLLWENKVMKAKKWSEVSARGVRAVYPVYFGQMQTYMAYMDLHNALFTAYNSDTSELYVEVVPFDQIEAQRCTDVAVRVLEAKNPEDLPRVTGDPSFYLCKWCPFSERCWDEPKKEPAPVPHWITRG